MTVSGGVAQNGNTSSAIPTFNVRRSIADIVGASFAQVGCQLKASLPSLKNGEAAHTSSSAYNDQGGTVTPSQIRFRKPRQRRSLRNEADCASCLTAPRSHFQPRLLPSKFTPMTGDSVGRRLDSLDSDSAVVIEVGQTLFQPRTHPGLLSGYSLTRGRLWRSCGANSCSKCALYESPLTFSTPDKSDYRARSSLSNE